MTHVRLLYALLALCCLGSMLTGCVAIENYYESPTKTETETVRYVQTSGSGCHCTPTADATHVAHPYYNGEETCCARCTHAVSSNTSEVVYIVVDADGNRRYQTDCPPNQRGGNPQVIYTPNHTSTPPIIPSDPRREPNRPIEDRVGGGINGTITTREDDTSRDEESAEYWVNDGFDGTITTQEGDERTGEERSAEYWVGDGVNGTITTTEPKGKGEGEKRAVEDLASRGGNVNITANNKKREEERPAKDPIKGGVDGILTPIEEEELTRIEENQDGKTMSSGRESPPGIGTAGEHVASQERTSTTKKVETSATNRESQREITKTIPVSATSNPPQVKVEEKSPTSQKTSSTSKLGGGNVHRVETTPSVAVEQQKPASTSSTTTHTPKVESTSTTPALAQEKQRGVIEEKKPTQSTSSTSKLGGGNVHRVETTPSVIVEQTKPVETSSTRSEKIVPTAKEEKPQQKQEKIVSSTKSTTASTQGKVSTSAPQKQEKIVSSTKSSSTSTQGRVSTPSSSTQVQAPTTSVGGGGIAPVESSPTTTTSTTGNSTNVNAPVGGTFSPQ